MIAAPSCRCTSSSWQRCCPGRRSQVAAMICRPRPGGPPRAAPAGRSTAGASAAYGTRVPITQQRGSIRFFCRC
eukprot:387426-Hanusia_phi.AAC.1